MRMDTLKKKDIVTRCEALRREGRSLGYIMSAVGLPKTTVYGYIKDVALTDKQRLDIELGKRKLLRIPSPRKGKCMPGREITKPQRWSEELVEIVAHFMFDGHIGTDVCFYSNRSESQIISVRSKVRRIFGIEPIYKARPDGVKVIYYYNVELADYIRCKSRNIFSYLKTSASKEEKRIFLKAFFDDEGNIFFRGDARRIRGYQKSMEVLKYVAAILQKFGIHGRIYPEIGAVEITGREQLEKFAKEIGFSEGIGINPFRKNSIWKKDIEKRQILDLALASYV
jgi:hypothetical protein